MTEVHRVNTTDSFPAELAIEISPLPNCICIDSDASAGCSASTITVRNTLTVIIYCLISSWLQYTTMWLKGFVSPDFFWLDIPGGALFGFSFFYVSFRNFWEMWGMQKNYRLYVKNFCTYSGRQDQL